MHIVLDTTNFHRHWNLKRAHFQALVRFAHKFKHTIVIPRVVIDEILRQYTENVEKLLKDCREVRIQATDMLLGDLFPKPDNLPDSKNVVADYRRWLSESLCAIDVQIPDYPSVSHSDLISQAVSGRKPFSADGKLGYKDALIWWTILELLSKSKDAPLAFITNNSKDFMTAEKDSLHPDLVATLSSAGINPSNVQVFVDLKDFHDEHIAHLLEPIDALRERVVAQLQSREVGTLVNKEVLRAVSSRVDEEFPPPYDIAGTWTPTIDFSDFSELSLVEMDKESMLSETRQTFTCAYRALIYQHTFDEPAPKTYTFKGTGSVALAATFKSYVLDLGSLEVNVEDLKVSYVRHT